MCVLMKAAADGAAPGTGASSGKQAGAPKTTKMAALARLQKQREVLVEEAK